MTEKNGDVPRDILNIDEAAELLGVSVKTFNKVLHAEDMPARKIGREWKFSRKALIEWVGSGRSREFYREGNHGEEEHEITPVRSERSPERSGDRALDRPAGEKPRGRRTAGWAIELD
jgi:excisionase family DNA binding protein